MGKHWALKSGNKNNNNDCEFDYASACKERETLTGNKWIFKDNKCAYVNPAPTTEGVPEQPVWQDWDYSTITHEDYVNYVSSLTYWIQHYPSADKQNRWLTWFGIYSENLWRLHPDWSFYTCDVAF
jgi:hypothetical protein